MDIEWRGLGYGGEGEGEGEETMETSSLYNLISWGIRDTLPREISAMDSVLESRVVRGGLPYPFVRSGWLVLDAVTWNSHDSVIYPLHDGDPKTPDQCNCKCSDSGRDIFFE